MFFLPHSTEPTHSLFLEAHLQILFYLVFYEVYDDALEKGLLWDYSGVLQIFSQYSISLISSIETNLLYSFFYFLEKKISFFLQHQNPSTPHLLPFFIIYCQFVTNSLDCKVSCCRGINHYEKLTSDNSW